MFASVVSSDGEVLVEPFKFSNDSEGFRCLSSKLDQFDKDKLLIGLESTAHYGNNLVEFLFSKGYRFCVLNPLQTSAMRKNNVRKTKTDRVDTFVIAKTLMMNPHRLFEKQDLDTLHLKNLCRFRQSLMKKRTTTVRSSLLSVSYFDIMTMSLDSVSGCTDCQESSTLGPFLSAYCN